MRQMTRKELSSRIRGIENIGEYAQWRRIKARAREEFGVKEGESSLETNEPHSRGLAFAIDLTIAKLLIRTIDSLHAKNDMPQELHHPPGHGIVQFRLDNPLPELHIVLTRSLQHLAPRDHKLRTARRANLLRLAHVLLRGEFLLIRRRGVQWRGARSLKDIPPDLLGDMLIETVGFLAAGVPIAAEVDVAVFLDEVGLKHAHGVDVVVEWSVIVPCHEEPCAMGVEKGDC